MINAQSAECLTTLLDAGWRSDAPAPRHSSLVTSRLAADTTTSATHHPALGRHHWSESIACWALRCASASSAGTSAPGANAPRTASSQAWLALAKASSLYGRAFL